MQNMVWFICFIGEGGKEVENILGTKQQAELIIRQYADMIFRIACQNTGSMQDAEDILQEVALTLLQKDAPLYDKDYIKPWLIRVTINKCRNLTNSAKRRKTEPLEDYIHLESPCDKGIWDDIMELPHNYRNVVYLFYYEGYSIDEIGKIMGRKPATIGSWLYRARKKLKTIITEGGNSYE
ncbi:MAG: RNA polymerase sigma factor [Ruminococcaceae bacterium]|nr:RNA polymerase sigma factor [Oscillospiraceae bacterium]